MDVSALNILVCKMAKEPVRLNTINLNNLSQSTIPLNKSIQSTQSRMQDFYNKVMLLRRR